MPRSNYKTKFENLQKLHQSQPAITNINTSSSKSGEIVQETTKALEAVKLLQIDLAASVVRAAREVDEYSSVGNLEFSKLETEKLSKLPKLPIHQLLLDAKVIIDVLTERNALVSEAYDDCYQKLQKLSREVENLNHNVKDLKAQLNDVYYIGIDATKDEISSFGKKNHTPRHDNEQRIRVPLNLKFKHQRNTSL